MAPQLSNGQHYVESARVYMKKDSSIRIKCCLCKADTFAGGEWEDFLRHLVQKHGAAGQVNGDVDEIQDEVQVELANLSEAGIGQEPEVAEHQEPELFTNVEFLEDEQVNDELSSLSEEESNQDEPGKISQQDYILNRPNKPFYSLQRTRPEIIHYFIELLRRHKFLWSSHRGTNRDDRLRSSQQVAEALFHRFGFQLQPQVIGASARFLQVWFERQYVMQLSNSDFRCRHPKYYRSLLRFMPTSHISVTICEECDRRFLNDLQLRLHKFRVHDGPNPNVCQVCHQGFPLASKLQQHQARYHFKPQEWQCGQCAYNAPSKWDFHQHQAMHAGERNYTCEVCGHSCKTSSALAVHRRTHDQPRLACPHCSRQFRENYTLKCHIRKFHEGDSVRRFSCSVCRRRFQTMEVLELHKLVHAERAEEESEEEEDP
ncbi:zinc finger protein 502 [Drosophila elegans]|uniref:zinc finger protein 502 n=1 Tax=Drosophila elegans TaxID=30023 RepID=UPI0007E6E901|nr:zinc finger protein 502 [Drosophila elegans]